MKRVRRGEELFSPLKKGRSLVFEVAGSYWAALSPRALETFSMKGDIKREIELCGEWYSVYRGPRENLLQNLVAFTILERFLQAKYPWITRPDKIYEGEQVEMMDLGELQCRAVMRNERRKWTLYECWQNVRFRIVNPKRGTSYWGNAMLALTCLTSDEPSTLPFEDRAICMIRRGSVAVE